MAFFSSSVAIIGGGASGTLVAAQLLRQATHPIHVLLYEPANAAGQGVAYGTDDIAHLLNVPAGKMSALPDEPAHFLNWLNLPSNCASLVNGGTFTADDFVPRAVYARYLAGVLQDSAVMAQKTNSKLEHRRVEVVDFIPGKDGGTVVDKSADTEDVAHVVLAQGNRPPRDPLSHHHPFFQSDLYVPHVWKPGALDSIHPDDILLIVGSGLTSLDIIASLHREKHRGKIYVTSRNGRLPHAHVAHTGYRDFVQGLPLTLNLRQWVRVFRSEVREAAKLGIDWRGVLDALRPSTQKIWQSLALHDRTRFLRHLRSFWECHRHRAPARVWQAMDSLRENGQLEFLPGRIRDFDEEEDSVTVSLQLKGEAAITKIRVSRVVNCIGPESNFRHRLNEPLIVNLLARGVIHPDPLFLGLEATANGEVIGADKTVHTQISTLGPPLRSILWETTAIPEIRGQAQRLANRILTKLHTPSWQI